MPGDPRYSGFKYHAKVHSFRFFTVILAWVLIAALFYGKPELLNGFQRSMQHGVEAVGDSIPSPWGPRLEITLREIGGVIWLQVTAVVIALRVSLSTIAFFLRMLFRR